jgi:hypothetical protein
MLFLDGSAPLAEIDLRASGARERQTHMNDDPVAGHVKNILPHQNYSLKSRAFTPPFAWLPNV